MAALSAATVVIEAGVRSGSMKIAHDARQLNRAVGAVPGPVTSASSVGPHELLRGNVAVLVTESSDVVSLIDSRQPRSQVRFLAAPEVESHDHTQSRAI